MLSSWRSTLAIRHAIVFFQSPQFVLTIKRKNISIGARNTFLRKMQLCQKTMAINMDMSFRGENSNPVPLNSCVTLGHWHSHSTLKLLCKTGVNKCQSNEHKQYCKYQGYTLTSSHLKKNSTLIQTQGGLNSFRANWVSKQLGPIQPMTNVANLILLIWWASECIVYYKSKNKKKVRGKLLIYFDLFTKHTSYLGSLFMFFYFYNSKCSQHSFLLYPILEGASHKEFHPW